MSTWLELASFSFVMALGQFSPGPDMLLLTRHSLQSGGKAGALTAAGIACGLAVHSAIALGGGAYLMAPDRPWFLISKCVATAYLLYLSIQILRSRAESTTAVESTKKHGRFFLRGLLCNLLNPKVVLILASVSAPYLEKDPTPQRMFTLGAIIVIQGLVLWIAWAGLLQWPRLRMGYQKHAKHISNSFAVLLTLLAIFLWL